MADKNKQDGPNPKLPTNEELDPKKGESREKKEKQHDDEGMSDGGKARSIAEARPATPEQEVILLARTATTSGS